MHNRQPRECDTQHIHRRLRFDTFVGKHTTVGKRGIPYFTQPLPHGPAETPANQCKAGEIISDTQKNACTRKALAFESWNLYKLSAKTQQTRPISRATARAQGMR